METIPKIAVDNLYYKLGVNKREITTYTGNLLADVCRLSHAYHRYSTAEVAAMDKKRAVDMFVRLFDRVIEWTEQWLSSTDSTDPVSCRVFKEYPALEKQLWMTSEGPGWAIISAQLRVVELRKKEFEAQKLRVEEPLMGEYPEVDFYCSLAFYPTKESKTDRGGDHVIRSLIAQIGDSAIWEEKSRELVSGVRKIAEDDYVGYFKKLVPELKARPKAFVFLHGADAEQVRRVKEHLEEASIPGKTPQFFLVISGPGSDAVAETLGCDIYDSTCFLDDPGIEDPKVEVG